MQNKIMLPFADALWGAIEDDLGQASVASFAENGPAKILNLKPSEHEALANATAMWNQEDGRNVYWSAGLRRHGLAPGARGGIADLTAMIAIVVDLDEPEAAKTWQSKLREHSIQSPSFVVRTSQTPTERYQLVWVLAEPETDLKAWVATATKLSAVLGGDHCSKDPAHVWRCPDTINYPNEKKRNEGRTQEMSELTENFGTVFELEAFEHLPEVAVVEPEVIVAPERMFDSVTQQWNVIGELLMVVPEWLQIMILCDKTNGQGRSHWDWQIAMEFARCGLSLGDYVAFYYLSTDEVFADKWREKERTSKGAGDKYLVSTFTKAEAKVLAEPAILKEEPAAELSQAERWEAGIVTFDDIKDLPDPEIEYVIEPWLPKGAITCVHGYTGSGKSHFVQHQLYAMATGQATRPFFVKEAVDVLYRDFEMGKSTIYRRIKNLRRAYGADNRHFKYFAPTLMGKDDVIFPNLQSKEHRSQVLAMAKRSGVEVVVVDNVRTSNPGMKENDSEAWGEFNDFLRELRAHEFTVVWVHHDNKALENRMYSGSTNAMTVTEVEIQLEQVAKTQMGELTAWVEDGSRDKEGYPTEKLRNAVQLKYQKHRDRDFNVHKDITLAFVENIEAYTTSIRVVPENDVDLGDERWQQLSLPERIWAIKSGLAGAPIASPTEIGKILGCTRQYVTKSLKQIEAAPESTRLGIKNVLEHGVLR